MAIAGPAWIKAPPKHPNGRLPVPSGSHALPKRWATPSLTGHSLSRPRAEVEVVSPSPEIRGTARSVKPYKPVSAARLMSASLRSRLSVPGFVAARFDRIRSHPGREFWQGGLGIRGRSASVVKRRSRREVVTLGLVAPLAGQPFAILAAENQLRPILQHYLVIPMRLRMQLLNPVNIHDRRAVNPLKAPGVEL